MLRPGPEQRARTGAGTRVRIPPRPSRRPPTPTPRRPAAPPPRRPAAAPFAVAPFASPRRSPRPVVRVVRVAGAPPEHSCSGPDRSREPGPEREPGRGSRPPDRARGHAPPRRAAVRRSQLADVRASPSTQRSGPDRSGSQGADPVSRDPGRRPTPPRRGTVRRSPTFVLRLSTHAPARTDESPDRSGEGADPVPRDPGRRPTLVRSPAPLARGRSPFADVRHRGVRHGHPAGD